MSGPAQEDLLGQVLDGKYRIVSRLGEGGMATVYRAECEGGPPVAIKVLSERVDPGSPQRKRFEREARALFGLTHPHILGVYDFGLIGHMPYLALELLDGTTLDRYIETQRPDVAAAIDLALQILEGLTFAHDQGVLHRDLKTENIFVTKNASGAPVAKLFDFGLAKFTDDERWGPEGTAITRHGSVMGTPAYMAPEQSLGRPATARSDVYSCGVILFELLTGTWPFIEGTREDMFRAHLTAPIPTLAETRPDIPFPPELEAVLQVALAKSPEDRFPDAGAMASALRAVPLRRANTNKHRSVAQLDLQGNRKRAQPTATVVIASSIVVFAALGLLFVLFLLH